MYYERYSWECQPVKCKISPAFKIYQLPEQAITQGHWVHLIPKHLPIWNKFFTNISVKWSCFFFYIWDSSLVEECTIILHICCCIIWVGLQARFSAFRNSFILLSRINQKLDVAWCKSSCMYLSFCYLATGHYPCLASHQHFVEHGEGNLAHYLAQVVLRQTRLWHLRMPWFHTADICW